MTVSIFDFDVEDVQFDTSEMDFDPDSIILPEDENRESIPSEKVLSLLMAFDKKW